MKAELCYNSDGENMKKILSGLLILLLILSGCQPQPTNDYQRFDQSTFDAGFDTITRLIAYAEDQETFDFYFNAMIDEFMVLHRLFDRFENYDGINNIKTINDQAGIAPVVVDPFIIDLLKVSKHWYDHGEHLLDITLGAVLDVWQDYREAGLVQNNNDLGGEIPTLEILKEAQACTGWDLVEIDETKSTVFLTKPCASLDVGATAKGYAAEVIARSLEEKGMQYGLLSAGGNVRSINTKADGDGWGVGIELPQMYSPSSADTLKIPFSTSIVTSGDYQRYYIGVDGEAYHHVIDPFTLFPQTYFHSVTIVVKDSGIADALSTILFLMSYEDGLDYMHRLQLENPDELIGAFWIFHKDQPIPSFGNITKSEGYTVAITDSLIPYSRIFANKK